MSNIISRISAHTKAKMAVLPLCMVLSRHGKTSFNILLEGLYRTPVLLSEYGRSCCCSSPPQDNLSATFHGHPECVVLFLAESLDFFTSIRFYLFV